MLRSAGVFLILLALLMIWGSLTKKGVEKDAGLKHFCSMLTRTDRNLSNEEMIKVTAKLQEKDEREAVGH